MMKEPDEKMPPENLFFLDKTGTAEPEVRKCYPLMCQLQQMSSAFLICCNVLEASMANSVDPDQTAPIGAVCSGSTLFASILNLSVMLGNYLQQTTSADDIFRCIFFLGALRVTICIWEIFHGFLPLY